MVAANPERINRIIVPELEAMLGLAVAVLDHGFVRLIDYMGSDQAIVQAARVSYGQGTKKIHQDRGLIRHLMRNMHTTPFEMCEIKLHLRVPMDHWRQWIRHRTANVNEYSTRYSVAISACQRTRPEDWRLQANGNRQGSDGLLPVSDGDSLTREEDELHRMARRTYENRLAKGVAREQARKDLPLSTYTEAYWKIDLHNLLHFLGLRLDDHAQKEIREYATAIAKIVALWCPLAWEAFQDYRLEAVRFSKPELRVLAEMLASRVLSAIEAARAVGWLDDKGTPKASGERREFEEKLRKLGHPIPWKERS